MGVFGPDWQVVWTLTVKKRFNVICVQLVAAWLALHKPYEGAVDMGHGPEPHSCNMP